MKRIYKHAVRLHPPVSEIALDEDAEVLHVGMQYDTQYLEDVVIFWAVHDDERPVTFRRFQVVGTGHPLPEGAQHRGTAMAPPFVWHLVELP